MTEERKCEWPPCGKPLKGKRKGSRFHSYECKKNWLSARARAIRHEEAEREGRKIRVGERSPDGLCLLPGCGVKLKGKQTRFCKYEHGTEYRDLKRQPKITPEEREKRIAGARCALEECGAPVDPERARRALRTNSTRFFCKPEHRERYWTRHGERKNKRLDPYAVLRALVPGSQATPFSPEAKKAIETAERALTGLRDALRKGEEATATEIREFGRDPQKLKKARESYAFGRSGLRGAAKILGVTAPTFADLLRRLGDEIRPQSAQIAATDGSGRKVKAPKESRPIAATGATPGSSPPPRPSATPPRQGSMNTGRSAPAASPPVYKGRESAGEGIDDEDDEHAVRRRIADVLAGNLKLPPKSLDPITEDADQAEWVRCRSWRRMLIGVQWAKKDPAPIIAVFLAETRQRANGTVPPVLGRAENELRGPRGSDTLFRVCSMGVDARRATGGSSADAENALCEVFRRRLPTAPNGFSTVGH